MESYRSKDRKNLSTYLKFLEYGEKKHDKAYFSKLNKIQLEEFEELIEAIQKKEIIIEQESFLIDN